MESVDGSGEVMPVKPATTKGDCKPQPCAEMNEAYQAAGVKTFIKRALESRSSYSHGTKALSGNGQRVAYSSMSVRQTDRIPPLGQNLSPQTCKNWIACRRLCKSAQET